MLVSVSGDCAEGCIAQQRRRRNMGSAPYEAIRRSFIEKRNIHRINRLPLRSLDITSVDVVGTGPQTGLSRNRLLEVRKSRISNAFGRALPQFWCLGRRRMFQHFFRMSQATTRQFNIRVKWSSFSLIHLWKKPTTLDTVASVGLWRTP